jgi:hypothetical protein
MLMSETDAILVRARHSTDCSHGVERMRRKGNANLLTGRGVDVLLIELNSLSPAKPLDMTLDIELSSFNPDKMARFVGTFCSSRCGGSGGCYNQSFVLETQKKRHYHQEH